MTGTMFSSPDLRAYFQSKRAGLEAQLVARVVEFIEATTTSLDCAIYDLRHPEVLAALAGLVRRGHVRVRIAYDGGGERAGGASGDPRPSGSAQAISQAGLSGVATAIHEHGRHLMHDKFLVRDGQSVWVGSANMTVGGLELQDNNCLDITSSALAAIYTATFEELISPAHQHEEHGPGRRATATHATTATPTTVALSGARVTPYFAPAADEGIENALVAAIRQARRIRILAFLLGDPGILEALAPYASDHHFDIRGIYDPHGMQDVMRSTQGGGHQAHAGRTGAGPHAATNDARFWFTHDPRFIAAPSHGFAPGREQDFMHNKVIIIDDRLVFTGSYNFSENAEANDETLLAIESPALATAYTAYFDTLAANYATDASHAQTPAREPVAVAAGSAAMSRATGASARADDVVTQLRRQHARGEGAATRADRRQGANQVRRSNQDSHAAAERHSAEHAGPKRSGLDGVIALVVALIILTALALVTFSALTLSGVVALPFMR